MSFTNESKPCRTVVAMSADNPTRSSPERHPEALSLRDKAVRFVFKRCMKDKHLRALVRKHWPVMNCVVEGFRFDLHPADNTTEFRLYMNRTLDERESLQTLVSQVAGKRALIVDIGANCGVYSIPLIDAAAAGSALRAFEPSPIMADRLVQNLRVNRLDTLSSVHRVALSSEDGSAVLNVHPKNHGQSSLRELDAVSGTVTVEKHTLDRYVDDAANFDRFIIKIDVEGREDDVLEPYLRACSEELLPDAVLIEIVLQDSWTRDLLGALAERGYKSMMEADGNTLFLLNR